MEKFIQTKSGLLLDQYQYSGGLSSDAKEQKARKKAVDKESAIIVKSESEFYNNDNVSKIRRKEGWK